MRRREFITLLGGAVAWPYGLIAQVSIKRPLVALLHGQSAASASPAVTAFAQRMQELAMYNVNLAADVALACSEAARSPALPSRVRSATPAAPLRSPPRQRIKPCFAW